jgi:peptide/nickel transport system permease protein
VRSVDATTLFSANDVLFDTSGVEIGVIEGVTPTEIQFSGNLAVSLSDNENLRIGQTFIPVDSVDATTVFAPNDRIYDDSGTVIGIISEVTPTQINLTGKIAVPISDNENLRIGQTVIPVDSVDATTMFAPNDRVYDDSGAVIGTVAEVTPTQINLTGNTAVPISDNHDLLREKTIDGVPVRPGDMVLVRGQNDPSENGIYVTSFESWQRVPSAITTADVSSGKYVWIEEGDANSNQMLEIATSDSSNAAIASLTFTQFSGSWTDNFSIMHTDTSGQVSEYAVNVSISKLIQAPINPNPLSSPAPRDQDEWLSIAVPVDSHINANLTTYSGSDYNLYLYGKRGNDIDSSRLHNGCPDFYSYGPINIPWTSYEVISEDDLLCPMGTTHTGSDMLSKILYGSRKSLRVGFVVALTTCFLGLVIGGVSGYFGRWVDEVIMRIADVFFAVPGLILAMAVVAAMSDVHDLGAIGFEDVKLDRLEKIMIALVFTGWPGYSRLIRGQVLYVKEHTYVEAARSVGSGNFRILFRHVLPNAWAPMLVAVSLDIGGTILTAAGLSFIGLGAEALSAEWGKMISDGRSFFPTHWWMVTFPGLAILITTLGFNLLGDGLRDVFDPKQRRATE